MIDMIFAHPHLFWLSLGGLLLAAEMLGGSGYLLWNGGASGSKRSARPMLSSTSAVSNWWAAA